MKAASRFLSAASAVALSAGLVTSATVGTYFASVVAASAAVVSRIDVRGNQRVDAETIRNYLGITPGKSFNNGDIDEAVKRLFATGLFADVRISQSGGTLIVQVDEYAIVNQVIFQGNKKIKDANLASAVQLKPRGSFSQLALDSDIETVKAAYARIGREDVIVNARTIELGGNRVNVVFEIQEGDRTKIATINFVGNNAFGDRRLRDVIATKQSNFLSFLFRNDVYDEDKLRADEEQLRRFYFNRGYADFQVVSSFAELNEAENEYVITITVDEGEKYRFGAIDVETTIEGVDAQSLGSSISTREGGTYSAKNIEDTIIALTEAVAGKGYAFAQVTPRGNRDFETRTISIVYSIDQGPRAYIERIEIRGNSRTRDYVIRREFDVSEGDAFNQVLIQRARRRLEALDYFESIDISTAPGSEPDQVVLIVDLVEKSTGEISIGGGYSTGETVESSGGFSVEGSIAERNFLGRGQSIRFSVSGGKDARDYMLSFTEPYFLGRRIAAGFDIYRQTRTYTNYSTELTGATVRFGLPITEALSTTLAYNLVQDKYKYRSACDVDGDGTTIGDPGECAIAPALATAIETQSPWLKSSVSGIVQFNTIDDPKNPHDGIFANFTTEVAGLGGDAKFVKFTARGSYYKTLSEEMDIVGLLSGGGGYIASLGGGSLRVFDHFESDSRIIRGFEYNGIGPADLTTGEHLGGTTYFYATAEAQFPLPVLPESFGLRGAVFADAATVYGNTLVNVDPSTTGMKFRASVGASIIWASPFGPLRVDYAIPVLKRPTDSIQNFNFGISTRF